MTLHDEETSASSRSGRGGKRGANQSAAQQARRPDPLRRLVSTTGPERAPDFFCVGGEPSSMTWLWQMLRHHPEIGVPIAPNMRHSGKPGSDARRGNLESIAQLLTEPAAASEETVRQIATELRLAVGTDKAYLRIFGGLQQKSVGEVSAHPSMLSAAGARRLQRLAPEAKVILLLDDPVERTISTASAGAASAGEPVDADAVGERARRLAASKHTMSTGIDHHTVAFGDRLYIAFGADIVNRAAQVLESMATILGVDPGAADYPDGGAFEPPPPIEVSPQLRRELYATLTGEYDALAERYPDTVAGWRTRQEELIA